MAFPKETADEHFPFQNTGDLRARAQQTLPFVGQKSHCGVRKRSTHCGRRLARDPLCAGHRLRYVTTRQYNCNRN